LLVVLFTTCLYQGHQFQQVGRSYTAKCIRKWQLWHWYKFWSSHYLASW
jgi:hypothetical protein